MVVLVLLGGPLGVGPGAAAPADRAAPLLRVRPGAAVDAAAALGWYRG